MARSNGRGPKASGILSIKSRGAAIKSAMQAKKAITQWAQAKSLHTG